MHALDARSHQESDGNCDSSAKEHHHGQENLQGRQAGGKEARSQEDPRQESCAESCPKAAPRAAAFAAYSPGAIPGMPDMSKMAKMMTPEQAIDLYKANTKIALDIINAASKALPRCASCNSKARSRLARWDEGGATRSGSGESECADGGGPDRLAGGGQSAMRYWGQMFELVVDMQKRLFTLMEGQMPACPASRRPRPPWR